MPEAMLLLDQGRRTASHDYLSKYACINDLQHRCNSQDALTIGSPGLVWVSTAEKQALRLHESWGPDLAILGSAL